MLCETVIQGVGRVLCLCATEGSSLVARPAPDLLSALVDLLGNECRSPGVSDSQVANLSHLSSLSLEER